MLCTFPPAVKTGSSKNNELKNNNLKEQLKKHAAHHSVKHMAEMSAALRRGQSFAAAHAQAQRKVGK